MPKQINSSYNEAKIPFSKMSYTPDVPSSALGANEYNSGSNVETDIRGIRSMAGDLEILTNAIPGTATYISGGFRLDEKFWNLVAVDAVYSGPTLVTPGKWYATSGADWFDVTPAAGNFDNYNQAQNITEAWNGTVPFFNDESNPPMFWPEDTALRLTTTAASASAGTATLTFAQQTPLQNIQVTNTAGVFTYTSQEALEVNQKITVAGTITNSNITMTATLSGVKITGTAGQFSATASVLTVGQQVTISGTLGGTGTITGYSNPTTYLISATNGSTTFTLVTGAGAPIVTTAGTPTGLTYTKGPGIYSTTGQFIVPVPTSGGYVKGQKVVVSGTLTGTGTITGYSSSTTYYIVDTNGSSYIQLSTTDGGTPVTTTVGTTTGLTFTLQAPSITGYTDPTTYYIKTTNGINQFTLSATLGGAAVTTNPSGQTITGATFVYFPFYVGESIVVTDVVPTAFNGSYTVTAATATTVSYALAGTLGPQTVAGQVGKAYPKMIMYSNKVPLGINNITYVSQTEYQITLDNTQTTPPYAANEFIVISNVNNYFNGTYQVITSTTSTINFYAPNGIGGVYPGNSVGTVAPQYSWNYNPNWSAVHAGWMRMYSTPNVGSILVAGNLTATNGTTGQIEEYPITVQWSQNFGLNEAPLTWTPTVTNVANQLEVPLRGKSLDAFPSNGQLFLCSYWDTVVFSPINFSTTSAPILGVRLYNQGRGLLSANCWVNTDKMVYGIDARDIWVFNGTEFAGLGNQRVKNWFFDQLDPQYNDRVFMEINSQRNQIEIYYTTKDAPSSNNGVPNKMLSYRYDLDCWNAPRDVSQATMACESPLRYVDTNGLWQVNYASRTVQYARGVANTKVVEKDQGYAFLTSGTNPNGDIASVFRRENVKLLPNYSGKLMIHRMLPEVNNIADSELVVNPATQSSLVGPVTLKMEGANSVGAIPESIVNSAATEVTIQTTTDNPWVQTKQNAYRVNNIEINNTSHTTMWICNSSTWQFSEVEDDR